MIHGSPTSKSSSSTSSAIVAVLAAALVLASAFACSRGTKTDGSPRALVGAGASLPYPLYSKWASEYARVEPAVRVNYQSIGSGAGVRQLLDGVVDFGATDEPMSDEQLGRTPAKLVHVPTTIGAVVLAFNLPGEHELSLTAELVAGIFLGDVKRWDDDRLRAANPGRALPGAAIVVAHRADGSGTSAAFTSYLSKTSGAWRDAVGAGTSPRFPVGVGAKGNEGVTAFVKSTPLSIGYVELAYAKQAGLATATVRNRAGKFVAPSLEALSLAAAAADDADGSAGSAGTSGADGDARVSIVDAPDEGAYPIAALSYVVVPEEGRDAARAEALAKFLWWATHDGQKLAPALDYAPLTPALTLRAERSLRRLRASGKTILAQTEGR